MQMATLAVHESARQSVKEYLFLFIESLVLGTTLACKAYHYAYLNFNNFNTACMLTG